MLKILEKLVLSQVSSYLNSHNLYNTCQSAYRPGHSTETALLKVVNDLFLSLNKGNISVLALLDFSSAFDTIDHTILVHRLHTDFGFTDTVLQWFSSYLTDRTQYVSLCNHCSDFAPVHSGVPQGSVLGPMLFAMYIKPLSAIIDSHSIIHHSFADDLQLQMSAPPDRISELLHSMQSCISDVKAWATANVLKINDSKTELMLVTSKRSKHLHNLPTSITMGNAQIPFKQSVKNLGFTLDCHLTMNAHVSNIARTCYFELRRLASIRRFLTSTATATLVSAFVLSRIDYCDSLLFGSTNDVTSHLQRIQNYAARVIFRLPMSSSITIHLKSLHWLPLKVRSTYKIACLCYHCHSSTAPSYVTDLLHKKPLHTRNTRSSSYTMPLLNRPAHSKATLGDRSFSFASSSVWNSIPNDVRCAPSLSSFKSRLKTSSRIWHLAVVTRLERVEDDSDYTKNVQRYWKGAVRDSRRRPCPTKPFQLALGQRGRYGPPLPIMSHTEKQIPAVPVGSADLNQGPTASPMGRGDVIQVLLPNMARTATHKPRTNKDKVTELHLATYNVRTLSDECHLVSLENEIEKIKWDIIGISEMRRPGENVVELASQHIMFNKGNDKKQGGVGFLIHKKLKGNIEEFHATSNRVASVTIRISKRYKIIIIQVYAPTSVSSQEELEEFYDDLQTEMRHKKTHYNVIMGDFNAKVGKGDEDCVGSFGYGVRNDRGDDLINFATAHGFKIMNTYYKKKKNRRWTWRCPNFETFNEIDYVLVDKNNIVKNFEVLNKVNVDSDHRMIRCKVQIDSKQERKRLC